MCVISLGWSESTRCSRGAGGRYVSVHFDRKEEGRDGSYI